MTKIKGGIENFILHKLDKAHTFDEIRLMLENAGFSKIEIDKNFNNIKKIHKTLHQDIAASNNYLPHLNKKIHKDNFDNSKNIGLFAGRVRRKDFIVSILFIFSLFFSTAIIVASFIEAVLPDSWALIKDMFADDKNGVIFLSIPLLIAPFLLAFLSLVTRRLHDLNLPGALSFLYLCVFIYPFSSYASRFLILLDILLFILFVILLAKKGSDEHNKHGKLPVPHGSTFTKILNLK